MAFPLIFSLNQILCSRTPLVPSVWPKPCVIPHVSTPSSSSALKTHILKLKHLPRASSQGHPQELIEDSKFVPLNAEDPRYGPPIQFLLKELDGEFLELATSLPRICFLSGLSGEEMMMFIDAFPETGLEPAVFAALVPNSADTPLRELVEEIMGDHEMLTAK